MIDFKLWKDNSARSKYDLELLKYDLELLKGDSELLKNDLGLLKDDLKLLKNDSVDCGPRSVNTTHR
ncbi:hypothetical protein PLEOSDRAFT_1072594, partial [Pleurotus ostreatus PC15]